MSANNSKKQNSPAPCRRSRKVWPVCYSNECYMNYSCPVYRGLHPNPERDYVPLPPVFVRVARRRSKAVSYHIPVVTNLD